MPSTIFTDNFTNGGADTDIASWQSTEQSSGSPDWDYHSGSQTASLKVSAADDKVYGTATATGGNQEFIARCINSAAGSANDYKVYGRLKSFHATMYAFICARLQAGSRSGYIVANATNSLFAKLYRMDAGVLTELDDGGSVGGGPNDSYIQVNGSTIVWFVGGMAAPREVIDTTYPTGKPGMGLYYWPALWGDPGTQIYVDNFVVEDLVPDNTADYTLDKKFGGFPFVEGGFVADFGTLDYKHKGFPFVGETAAPPGIDLTAGGNTVLVSAPALFLKVMDRVFPLKRVEDQRESQVKHINPLFDIQDPALIP